MIQLTTQQKRRQFSMPTLRRRCKKMMRKKFGKTVKLSRLDQLLDQYVRYEIIPKLLKDGKVQIDKYTELEIVGKRPEKDARYSSLLLQGKVRSRTGRIMDAKIIGRNRKDYIYKITCTDSTYKGQIIFEPDKKLSALVRNELETTSTYYRLLN